MSKWYRPIENGIMTLPEVAVGSNNYLMYLNGKYQVFPVSMYLPIIFMLTIVRKPSSSMMQHTCPRLAI